MHGIGRRNTETARGLVTACLTLALGFTACAAPVGESGEAAPIASTTTQTTPVTTITESPVTQPATDETTPPVATTAQPEPATTVPETNPPAEEEASPASSEQPRTRDTPSSTIPPPIDPGIDFEPPPPIEPVPPAEPARPRPETIKIRVAPLPGTLALTFDDGPEPVWTPVILDILAERGIKATFFVIGRKVDLYPEIAQRIVDEGHSLQSHAYYHHNLTNRSEAAVAKLIDDGAEAIFNATGTTPVCLRPPAGITNSRLSRIAAEHGHQVVLWTPNGSSLDYSNQSTSGVIRRASHWDVGEVALMHDTWGWLHRDALPVILNDLDSRGIDYSTICVPIDVGPGSWTL